MREYIIQLGWSPRGFALINENGCCVLWYNPFYGIEEMELGNSEEILM